MATIEPTVVSKLIDLIPVATGAVIALAGGAIKYWVDTRDRRRQVKREKLERVIRVAHELKDWTSQVDDRYIFQNSSGNVPSLMDEMLVLSSLYFPELKPEIDQVVMAAKGYKLMALQLGSDRLGANGAAPADQNERVNSAYSPLVSAISSLTEKAEKLAAKLL